MREYSTTTDGKWYFVSGGDLDAEDEKERKPHWMAAERTILCDALFAKAKHIVMDGKKVDVLATIKRDGWFVKYHPQAITALENA